MDSNTVLQSLPFSIYKWIFIASAELHSFSAISFAQGICQSFASKFQSIWEMIFVIVLLNLFIYLFCIYQFIFLVILMVTVIINILVIIDSRDRLQQQQHLQTNEASK